MLVVSIPYTIILCLREYTIDSTATEPGRVGAPAGLTVVYFPKARVYRTGPMHAGGRRSLIFFFFLKKTVG